MPNEHSTFSVLVAACSERHDGGLSAVKSTLAKLTRVELWLALSGEDDRSGLDGADSWALPAARFKKLTPPRACVVSGSLQCLEVIGRSVERMVSPEAAFALLEAAATEAKGSSEPNRAAARELATRLLPNGVCKVFMAGGGACSKTCTAVRKNTSRPQF
jgi:hypothetical protein